jgi:WD40 repeat protein
MSARSIALQAFGNLVLWFGGTDGTVGCIEISPQFSLSEVTRRRDSHSGDAVIAIGQVRNTVVSCSSSCLVVWDMFKVDMKRAKMRFDARAASVAFCEGASTLLVGTRHGQVLVYATDGDDWTSRPAVATIDAHTGGAVDSVLSVGGTQFWTASSGDGLIRAWHAKSRESLSTVDVWQQLAAQIDSLKLCSVASGHVVVACLHGTGGASSQVAAFSSDSASLLASADGSSLAMSLVSPVKITTAGKLRKTVSFLSSGKQGSLCLWKLRTDGISQQQAGSVDDDDAAATAAAAPPSLVSVAKPTMSTSTAMSMLRQTMRAIDEVVAEEKRLYAQLTNDYSVAAPPRTDGPFMVAASADDGAAHQQFLASLHAELIAILGRAQKRQASEAAVGNDDESAPGSLQDDLRELLDRISSERMNQA